MRIYLQTLPQDGQNLRFYQLSLQRDMLDGWTLIKESGFQGSSGRVYKESYKSWDEAQAAMLTARDKQIKRGYQVVFTRGDRPADSQ
jgi:predicted DNA-binding WGR domain protein